RTAPVIHFLPDPFRDVGARPMPTFVAEKPEGLEKGDGARFRVTDPEEPGGYRFYFDKVVPVEIPVNDAATDLPAVNDGCRNGAFVDLKFVAGLRFEVGVFLKANPVVMGNPE